jgi:hypothetical protein
MVLPNYLCNRGYWDNSGYLYKFGYHNDTEYGKF